MNINQFVVYQVKMSAEFRTLRFRPYSELQEKNLRVDISNYEQVYLSQMAPDDSVQTVRKRLEEKIPKTFKGHSISVSDVIVMNKAGVVSAYYVDKDKLIAIAGFLRLNTSGSLVSMDTTEFKIDGKPGTWLACDDTIVDGKQFFLMQNEQMKNSAACVIVNDAGKVIVNEASQFNETAIQQIRAFLHPPVTAQQQPMSPLKENWQRYYENGEYVRNVEGSEEQNYSFVDGNKNNPKQSKSKSEKRPSVLKKLHEKQAEIARRNGKAVPQAMMEQEAERKRK
ncbi:MAG: YodL domain-containing protein [Oscillospiraceae bacterium]|nr:YodL domain-containing protein [Oscillospiraceae bacterium]